MSMESEPGGAGKRVIWVILLVVAVLIGGVVWVGLTQPGPEPVAVAVDPGAVEPAPAEAPDAEVAAAPAVPEIVEPEAAPEEAEATAAPEATAPELPSAPEPVRPSFDVVRVEPDGSTVVAGRAAPGAEIAVQLDGATVGTAQADAQGGFVAILDLGHSEAPRALSLNAEGADGATASEQVVVVAPSVAVPVLEVPGEAESAGTETVAEAVPEPEPSATEPVAEAAPEPEPEPEPVAPSVILADSTGVRVLQGGDDSPEVASNVVIDAITYDAEGEVALSGRAPGDGYVRVYIDNAPIEAGQVGPGGQWHVDLPKVDTGTYTLRVDQVGAGGQVLSRAETPFRREAPEAIQALADEREVAEGKPLVELITVQPGNTLWGISQRMMGEGTMYVQLFEANRDKIRDPDLIYPGQVFSIPE